MLIGEPRGRQNRQLTLSERRARNRSLSSILCTPPLYPGYSACIGSIAHISSTGDSTFLPYEESLLSSGMKPTKKVCGPLPPVFSRTVNMKTNIVFMEEPTRPTFCISSTPPLCSPEDDSEFQSDSEVSQKKPSQPSGSSGYGSASSESDQEGNDKNLITKTSIESKVANQRRPRAIIYRIKQEREIEKLRRRSVPASLRNAFSEDIMKILQKDGHVNYETDVDSGLALGMEVRGLNRPESVIQLARRFGEIGAAQHNNMHKSRSSMLVEKENTKLMGMSKSGPCTPVKTVHSNSDRLVGGIASLRTTAQSRMSRPNMFKQMEKVSSSSTISNPRTLNPNSIKDALLRWVQNRVQGYPNINVVNFSSSWADGMAFCALIHRFVPDAFDFAQLDPSNRRYNLELAFRVAEENGVCQLLEVDDMIMMGDRPDWKSYKYSVVDRSYSPIPLIFTWIKR